MPNDLNKSSSAILIDQLREVINRRDTVSREWALPPTGPTADISRGVPDFVDDLPFYLSPIEKTFDEMAQEAVRPIIDRLPSVDLPAPEYSVGWRQFLKYSPRLYETMLSEAATLLNRCESYRREGNDAAARAIREAYDLVTRDSLRLNQRHLLEIQLAGLENSSQRASGIQAATGIFGRGSPLASGQAQLADTEGTYLNGQVELDRIRIEQNIFALEIDERFDRAQRHQQLVPGGALNNIDTYERAARFFREDIAEAYERLISAAMGMASDYGGFSEWTTINPLPLPEDQFFDDLISWARNAIRKVDEVNLADQEIVVPIQIGGGAALIGLITPFVPSYQVLSMSDALTALENREQTELTFSIEEHHLPKTFTNFRLLTIGMCYFRPNIQMPNLPHTSPEGQDTIGGWLGEDGYYRLQEDTFRFSATITLPSGGVHHSPINSQSPPPPIDRIEGQTFLPVGAVGPISADGNFMEIGGPQVLYSTPLGPWAISIPKTGIDAVGSKWLNQRSVLAGTFVRPDRVAGIVLYLRLLARPK
jgi:hypothetical protein